MLKKSYRKLMLGLGFAFLSQGLQAQITAGWQYETPKGDFESYTADFSLMQETGAENPVVLKTINLVKYAEEMKNSIELFNSCQPQIDFPTPCSPCGPGFYCLAEDSNIAAPAAFICPYYADAEIAGFPVESRCKELRLKAANDLRQSIQSYTQAFDGIAVAAADEHIYDVLDLGRKLAQNMEDNADASWGGGYGWEEGFSPAFDASVAGGASFAGSPGLSVTSGGAQDFAFFRSQVEAGQIPDVSALPVEAFLKEFQLSLGGSCDKLICVDTAQAVVKAEDGSLEHYMQVSMNSNVTEETFNRKPLNMSLVIDISGSMQATDETEKTRLEWAKTAAIKTIENLNAEDYLSVVTFHTESAVVIPTTQVKDKQALIAVVESLQTEGSTNLEAGLSDGFRLVSLNHQPGYENRVILLSDAGLNTGVTDEGSLVRLVSDYAGENIGLTAFGLGLNFNQDFIEAITLSQGGNYVFVNNGRQMFDFFQNFDFLVTPAAYNLKIGFELPEGLIVDKSYGVHASSEDLADNFINIRTLFFSRSGGAILLKLAPEFVINETPEQ